MLPKRKHPRLKAYDYSQSGCYFITIQTCENAPLLSTIEYELSSGLSSTGEVFSSGLSNAGHGLAPNSSSVGRGLAPAAQMPSCTDFDSLPNKTIVTLTSTGRIIQTQLFDLEERYAHVVIDQYIIMPTHIHAIIILRADDERTGMTNTNARPTIMDIVCAFKSITTRLCNQHDQTPGRKLFQTSFYENVIRNEKGYEEVCRYIYENPMKWLNGIYEDNQ